MTSPVVTPIESTPAMAWLVSPQTVPTLMTGLGYAVASGYTVTINAVQADPINNPTAILWELILKKAGYPDLPMAAYDWLVFDGTNFFRVYNGPTFASIYTMDVPLAWAATTVAPVATALMYLQASIVFPAPTSPNAPFTYTVNQTVGGVTTSAELAATSVENGIVTLTVSNLTQFDEYTFTVVIGTRYTDTNGTQSLPSNLITATTANIVAEMSSNGQLISQYTTGYC